MNIFRDVFLSGSLDDLYTRPFRWDIFKETDLQDVFDRYGEGLNTLADEFYYRAITGQIDIESDWDSYVSNWLSNGGQEYLDQLSKTVQTDPLNDEGKVVY